MDKDMKITSDDNLVFQYFRRPKKRRYFGKLRFGTPYFYPVNFNKNIITIRKLEEKPSEQYNEYVKQYPHLKHMPGAKFTNVPMVRRGKYWIVELFKRYFYIEIGWPISIGTVKFGWKDKFDTPRAEWSPAFYINFFGLQYYVCYADDDDYFEQILWFFHYAEKDIDRAKKTWPWSDYDTKESTWNDEYLIKGNE